MALIEQKGKTTILKTGETESELECPDKDFTAKAEGESVVIQPTKNVKFKAQ